MFKRWLNPPRCPIGIDVGTHSVRMMQVSREGDHLAVIAAARAALSGEANGFGDAFHQQVAGAIRRMIDAGRFVGNTVVSCLPAPVMHCKNLRLPKMPPDELPEAVRWEANDRLHLGEPAFTQFIDAGVVRQGEEERQEVILLAATNTVIDQHARALIAAGLVPMAIDAIPAALARCVGRHDAERVQVVIDVGYAQSKVLICRGDTVLFYKQIDVGGRTLDRAVAEKLDLPAREAAELRRAAAQRDEQVRRSVDEAVRPRLIDLAREIGLCLRYYSVTFRGQRPDTALLLGGEAHDTSLAQLISEGAAIGVEQGDPLAGVDLTGAGDLGDHADWAVALGLALRPLAKAAGKRGAA